MEAIPGPSGLPLVGNFFDIQGKVPVQQLEKLADAYGPIFKLRILGRERIFISSVALMEEISDEKRFWKSPGDSVADLQKNPRGNRGLFLAASEEDLDWQQAHRILLPAFGPLGIEEMFPEMYDLAVQLVLKWARMGPSYRIPVTTDLTRATFDTIAKCTMGYRFNSFYSEQTHPFLQAMDAVLSAASDRLKVGSILRQWLPWDNSAKETQAKKAFMSQTTRQMVQSRHGNPEEKRDLLNLMINGKDPKTKETMRDGLIAANMITFLIAGHETTSGMLAFALIFLLQNPRTYVEAQREVDNVIGHGPITLKELKKLDYLSAVLRETLRLCPSLPEYARSIRSDNPNDVEFLAGGKYAIKRGDKVHCLLAKIQTDPEVYGGDSQVFKPERMLGDAFNRLPMAAWAPFGTGRRGCIGRAFTWQEGLLILAMILQSFELRMDDPTYQMSIRQTLSVKPEGFYIRASLRKGITPESLQYTLLSREKEPTSPSTGQSSDGNAIKAEGKNMTILYGSNTGTCQSLAERLAIEASKYGYDPVVTDLNTAVNRLARDGRPIVIITTSYDGEPADNARQFVDWLQSLNGEQLIGVSYAIFGCGHSDWASTFHKVPILLDKLMVQNGARNVAPRGLANAADGNISSTFDAWTETVLWKALATDGRVSPLSYTMEVQMSKPQERQMYLRHDGEIATIIEARRLTDVSCPEKRHLSIQLPDNMSYTTGDYLTVVPLNSDEEVSRVMRRLKILANSDITIKETTRTFLPRGTALSVRSLLEGFVELAVFATVRDLKIFAQFALNSAERIQLDSLAATLSCGEKPPEGMPRLLDVLDDNPSINIPFATFLAMLPPLQPRCYSISSSPLVDPTACTITYSVIANTIPESNASRQRTGVASGYLASLKKGDKLLVSVRNSNRYFRLPQDLSRVPIIMIGAGTGIAPFRGFIEERVVHHKAGKDLAPALMFIGCRSACTDRLYAEEVDAWAARGIIDIRYAFSREPGQAYGCRYVQDRIKRDAKDVRRLWRDGAKIFTCGGRTMAAEVTAAIQLLLLDNLEADIGTAMDETDAARWFQTQRNSRYVVDVFA